MYANEGHAYLICCVPFPEKNQTQYSRLIIFDEDNEVDDLRSFYPRLGFPTTEIRTLEVSMLVQRITKLVERPMIIIVHHCVPQIKIFQLV